MEVKYTISQVSKFTGVTIDAIRLYEKEGLICPKRDDNNNYRYYDVELIRRIIFIAFYRKIDVSIPEIAPLITSSSLSDIRSTFDELINSNTKKIEQLHTKIKKLTVLNKSLGELSSNIGIYSLCVMPKCYRMMEKINADTESHKMGAAISSPMFTFGNIGYQADLSILGIEVTIKQEDWNVFLADRKSGNYSGMCREGWLADYNDPINMLEIFTSDSGNNDMQLGK